MRRHSFAVHEEDDGTWAWECRCGEGDTGLPDEVKADQLGDEHCANAEDE